ncbi:glycine receptor subunit alpha-2-like isoform X2 [Ornithodoros turicata]
MSDEYDKLNPPKENDQPVMVNISVAVVNIRTIDEGKQFYEMDIFFHQYWTDKRLKGSKETIVLDNKWRDHLWTPETYFKNSVDGKLDSIIFPYMYMTLDEHGNLFFAARLSLKLTCSMDLTRYPHDEQECDIQIMSFLHNNRSVMLRWKKFTITKNLSLSQFTVTKADNGDCTRTYEIGTFECLFGRVVLRRRLGFFLINKYVPSVLIVAMSFVTFWIPAEAIPARVTLSVTSLLTIVTQQYQSSMPQVSYVVALNVWMLACIAFVFLGLIEYAFVVTCMELRKQRAASRSQDLKMVEPMKEGTRSYDVTRGREDGIGARCLWRCVDKPRSIDRYSRILFPAAFILHVLLYWAIYGRH